MVEMGETPQMPPATLSGAIGDSLIQARLSSAAFMNRIRLFLGLGFVLLYGVAIFWLNDGFYQRTLGLIIGYAVGAGLLQFLANRSKRILNLSRFAVPLFDVPVATVIQWFNLDRAESAEGTTMFTLSIYVFLTVMTSFSIRTRYLVVCAVISTLCIWLLEWQAGLPGISYISAPLMLTATVFGMHYMVRRQTSLIRDAAERKARRDRLARHFSPGVAEVIESRDDPGKGEVCELTVLFCDIRGFTKLSESIDAQEVIQLLNEFHSSMVNAIFRFGGTLDKYLGDGLLAYFNAPSRQKDHAERGVRCALAMIEDLETLNKKRFANGEAPIKIGIGLHSGKAVVGEIGATHRREFTAIGDTVNVGSRIEGLTKDHESDILVSQAVVDQVRSFSEELAFESAGTVPVRGRDQPIGIFVPSIPV